MEKIPVLFVIFNRAEIAARSFARIREYAPTRLFIAGDGARPGIAGEEERVESTRRAILDMIDWDCKVETLFQPSNLGCGPGVHRAIDWFFGNVEEGVILEDDCVAEPTFFRYAAEMLDRFRDDFRFGMIAGTNPIPMPKDYPYSVVYSKYKSCWGWATWRRAWRNMDLLMDWRNGPQSADIVANCGFGGKDIGAWRFKLGAIDRNEVSAWDWQWYFALSAQNQLCVYPLQNQVSNYGNTADATHTSASDITIPSSPLPFPLKTPSYPVPSVEFDRAFYATSQTLRQRLSRLLPHSLKVRLKKTICLR